MRLNERFWHKETNQEVEQHNYGIIHNMQEENIRHSNYL